MNTGVLYVGHIMSAVEKAKSVKGSALDGVSAYNVRMTETTVPKGKAIKLSETGGKDYKPSKSDIEKSRDLARRISPTLLAMFDAEEYKPEADTEKDQE